MPGYGTEAPYGTTAAPYNPYVPYQIPSQIAATQPIHYQYQPVYTPPPPNPTPPITAAAPAPAPIPLAETDAYGDFKKMLMADKAEREARDAAASKAQEEKLAALEDARKRAEEIAKAAAAAATEARTEAETKATAEQKKLKDEADEAATKAKADAEAAAKKFGEEKDAAVKAAEAAGAAAAAVPPEKQKPIKFKDAIGRKFSFPFHLCKTWEVSFPHNVFELFLI